MRINDLLLSEFDEEVKKTRTMLERVPAGRGDFVPHPKSMPLGRLAPQTIHELRQVSDFGSDFWIIGARLQHISVASVQLVGELPVDV